MRKLNDAETTDGDRQSLLHTREPVLDLLQGRTLKEGLLSERTGSYNAVY